MFRAVYVYVVGRMADLLCDVVMFDFLFPD